MDLSAIGLDTEVKDFLKTQQEFVIDRVSQEGGNCDIFFGYHKIFERRIALKVYSGIEGNGTHYEPRILSSIEHPNILRVRDAKRIGDCYSYFMTDEISGGDLEKCLLNDELDLMDKLNIIHGVLNGLTELHKKEVSIVHRDLKPKNILLDKDTKQALIADFGSVKQFDVEKGSVSGSKTTLMFRPKEVVEENLYTKQSDIYQVGVTMFQILGGHFPPTYFEWLNPKEVNKYHSIIGDYEKSIFIDSIIYKRIVKNDLLQTNTLPKFVDKSIVRIVQRAIHPNLNIRYSNTAEFMKDLYMVQKRLTNWAVSGNFYYAETHDGGKYRISEDKKGFVLEKFGASGWRRSGDHKSDIQPLFDIVNSK